MLSGLAAGALYEAGKWGAKKASSIIAPAVRDELVKRVGEQSVDGAFGAARQVLRTTAKSDFSGPTDLISFTQSARIEPIMLVDQKALMVPFISDVSHTMLSLFTGYFLQAIAIDTNISGIRAIDRLDKFNPDRNLQEATRSLLSMESASLVPYDNSAAYAHGLPFPGVKVGMEAYGVQVSFEAEPDFSTKLRRAIQNAEVKKRVDEIYGKKDLTEAEMLERARRDARIRQQIEAEFAKPEAGGYEVATRDISKMVNDVTNMAVGKVIEVTITENGQSVKVPITIRMRATSMPSNVLMETLSVGGVDYSASARLRAWRAGELRFWSDIVLGMDRIDAHRAAAVKDTSGYYSAVHKRDTNNKLVSVMKGTPSIGTASSVIVMHDQTRKDLERNINGRLSDFKVRQGIFQNTFSMLMAVVDPEWETITIYHRGIEMPTELSAKDLKTASKGNGPDLAEILKAYQLGAAPSRL